MKKVVVLASIASMFLVGCGSDPLKDSVILSLGQDNYRVVSTGENQLQAMKRANKGARGQCESLQLPLVVRNISVEKSGAFNASDAGLNGIPKFGTNLDAEALLHTVDLSTNYYATLLFACTKDSISGRALKQKNATNKTKANGQQNGPKGGNPVN